MDIKDWVIWLLIMLNNVAVVAIFGVSFVIERRYKTLSEEVQELRREMRESK